MSEKKRNRLLVSSCAMVFSASASAQLTFNLIPAQGMDPQAIAGFQAAAARWSANFTDSETINININFTTLGATTLAQTSSTTYTSSGALPSYSSFVSSLKNKRVSADDFSSFSALQNNSKVINGTFKLWINYTSDNPNGNGSATPYLESANLGNDSHVSMTNANAKAVGLLSANSTATDATITFNSSFSYDFNPVDGIDAGKIDFVGVVTHEIGHALGFNSGVDILDSNSPESNGTYPSASQLTYVSPLDLFRYSTASVANGTGVEDWTASTTDKYFSVDGGVTKIASFATGVNHGDGQQASHWKDNLGLGIMDPTFAYGELGTISNNDIRSFDVIGYTRNNTWKWTDTSSASTSKWSNSPGWNTDAIPDSTITVFFNNTASNYTVNITSPATAAAMTVGKDNVTLNIAGGSLTSGALTLGASSGDAATMKLQRSSGTGTFSVGTIAIGSVANSTGSLAVLSGSLNGSADLAVGGTSSASAGGGALSISGGNVSITGNLKIWGTSGSSATMSSGSLTVGGSSNVASGGKMFVTGGAFSTNGLTVSGTYSQTGGTATLGAVTVNSGASFTSKQILATSMTINGLASISPNLGTASRVTSLSIPAGGKLDMENNSLVIPYSGTSPVAQIRQMISNAYDGSLWDGSTGITSSYAMNDTTYNTGVAYAEASDLAVDGGGTFEGQSITNEAVIVKYTYNGDSNLDGVVTTDDFFAFVAGFNGQGSGWAYGDYNYDGAITSDDLFIFVSAFNQQGAPLSELKSAVMSSAALSVSDRAMMLSIIPEPGTLSLLGISAAGLLCRRRRSR